jgi:hypothetical protein
MRCKSGDRTCVGGDGGGLDPKIREFKPPKSFGQLSAFGSRDTIGDHPVSVVRHSGPLDMKLEITA